MLVKDIIQMERKKRGISASQLAEMLGINKGTIHRYENGSIKEIPIYTLKKLSEIFDYSFDEFVCDDPKYCMLTSHKGQNTNIQMDEDERLILNWYHCLPMKHQEFLIEIAKNYTQ